MIAKYKEKRNKVYFSQETNLSVVALSFEWTYEQKKTILEIYKDLETVSFDRLYAHMRLHADNRIYSCRFKDGVMIEYVIKCFMDENKHIRTVSVFSRSKIEVEIVDISTYKTDERGNCVDESIVSILYDQNDHEATLAVVELK